LQPAGRSSTNAPPGTPGAPKPAAHRTAATFAQTPSRFVNNHRVTHAHLLEPLLAVARRECQAAPGRVHLVVHDWSTLSFSKHTRKADRATLQGSENLGYDLHLALLVNADDGSPLDLTLRTVKKVLTTRPKRIPLAQFPAAHVDPVQASRVAEAASSTSSTARPTRSSTGGRGTPITACSSAPPTTAGSITTANRRCCRSGTFA